jgi:RHS repeat-associated protein
LRPDPDIVRYVHGPGTDDPLMRLTGDTASPAATARYYHQNGINSVVALSGDGQTRINAVKETGASLTEGTGTSYTVNSIASSVNSLKDGNPSAAAHWTVSSGRTLDINLAGSREIEEVVLIGNPGPSTNPTYPQPKESDLYGTTSSYDTSSYTVQSWDGAAWVTQASVSGNTNVIRHISFAPVTTTKLRIIPVDDASNGQTPTDNKVSLAEVEVYTTPTSGGSQLQRFDAWGNKTQSAGAAIPQYGYTGREPDGIGLMTTPNLALNRAASSSSIWASTCAAANANDGSDNVADACGGWSPVAAATDAQPWWQVDLGSAYRITGLELVTRQNCCDDPETRHNFEIRASNDASFASYVVLGSQGSTTLPFQATWTQSVSDPTAYRYVRAIKTGYFFITELRVLGSPTPGNDSLVYYRARYYDPTIGRFISRDPAGMPDGVNRYAYVGNSPTNFTDPSGEIFGWDNVLGAVFNAGVGAAVTYATGGGTPQQYLRNAAVDLGVGFLSSGAASVSKIATLSKVLSFTSKAPAKFISAASAEVYKGNADNKGGASIFTTASLAGVLNATGVIGNAAAYTAEKIGLTKTLDRKVAALLQPKPTAPSVAAVTEKVLGAPGDFAAGVGGDYLGGLLEGELSRGSQSLQTMAKPSPTSGGLFTNPDSLCIVCTSNYSSGGFSNQGGKLRF